MKPVFIEECRAKLKEWFVGTNIDSFSNEEVLAIYLKKSVQMGNSTDQHVEGR